MRSKMIIGTVLALATLFAVPAMANEKGEHASFPMPAATFQAKVNEREAKAREHMEKRASELPADQAAALRARFDAGEAKINAQVAKVTADGTVTKEEAQEVRQVVHEVRPWHHKKEHKQQQGA
jgi:hypothetical protein